MEILNQLNIIFKYIFENQDIKLSINDNIADIDGWSSLNHLILISEIEKYYNIKFKVFELMNFYSIKDIVDAIENKI